MEKLCIESLEAELRRRKMMFGRADGAVVVVNNMSTLPLNCMFLTPLQNMLAVEVSLVKAVEDSSVAKKTVQESLDLYRLLNAMAGFLWKGNVVYYPKGQTVSYKVFIQRGNKSIRDLIEEAMSDTMEFISENGWALSYFMDAAEVGIDPVKLVDEAQSTYRLTSDIISSMFELDRLKRGGKIPEGNAMDGAKIMVSAMRKSLKDLSDFAFLDKFILACNNYIDSLGVEEAEA